MIYMGRVGLVFTIQYVENFFFFKSAKKLLLVWKLPKVVKFKFVRIVLVDLPGYWGNNDRCKQIRC